MSSDVDQDFFGDKSIENLVETLWSNVFKASNKLIRDTRLFAFGEIESLPKPNVHQMLKTLTVFDSMLDQILTLNQNGKLDLVDTRLIFNAKQQILVMERIATALRNHDRAGYDEAVIALEKQAPI